MPSQGFDTIDQSNGSVECLAGVNVDEFTFGDHVRVGSRLVIRHFDVDFRLLCNVRSSISMSSIPCWPCRSCLILFEYSKTRSGTKQQVASYACASRLLQVQIEIT